MKIKVSSIPERFRRAGMEFGREPKEVEVDEKTYEILKAEPLLRVERVSGEEKEKDPAKKGKRKE